MQFKPNLPDIPNELLEAHEEGRVVFFCGAGISRPAGLPDFEGLVKEIYRLTGTQFSKIEQTAFDRGEFDVTLNLLEQRLPRGTLAVRRKLAEILLKPDLGRSGATDAQAALLCLARSRDDRLRLVTTNFDRIFHHVALESKIQTFQAYTAPMLPICNNQWNGLVYLHGLLPEKADDEMALNQLVVTSADFGLAYLVERWAARFVSELFRNYVVCFVGYSINDPILRYMMDALATYQSEAWALVGCKAGQEKNKTDEWKSKGVKPIFYNIPTNKDHSVLYQTLKAWADIYRDGVQSKQAIIARDALALPQNSTQEDNFVGRVLWALSDKSGLPAKQFADLNPVPSLDWLLDCFTDDHFKYPDLPMLLVSGSGVNSQWDDVTFHLARWLTRHLDDPELIFWIAERGGQLHDRWLGLIEDKLAHFARLEHEGNFSELDEIRKNAPKAIPSPPMRILWRLLFSGRVKSPQHYHWKHNLFLWENRLNREGLTTTLRLNLRELLAPQVILKKPVRETEAENTDTPRRLQQLVNCELVLAVDHVHSTLEYLAKNKQWKSALPHLLEDFQQLLRDALDLLRELGRADDHNDNSYWDLKSITPHWQNRGFCDWVSLIELLRDAWLAVLASDSPRARRIAEAWFDLPHPTFKRLALFAASQDGCIPPKKWVDWLLVEDAWWLWSNDTRREVCRLFVLQGRLLVGADQERLETAILAGPPRKMYRCDLGKSRSIWLRLFKLKEEEKLTLGESAETRLTEISHLYSESKSWARESYEFPGWMSVTGDPDYEYNRQVDIAPRNLKDLVEWLKKPKPQGILFYEDTWRDVCRVRFSRSLYALCELSKQGEWPADRWREALQVWAEAKMILLSWQYAAPLLVSMPDETFKELIGSIAWWIDVASQAINCHENILLDLCRRVLAIPLEAGSDSYHVARALIHLWFKRSPKLKDNDLLPADLKPIFTNLCDVQVERFRHGRIVLASYLITFFRVDRLWAEEYLLPLFDWKNSAQAKAAWEGFLYSPRLYPPLLIAFKSQFLEAANHYAELGMQHRKQFLMFLTYVALERMEGYTVDEFRTVIARLAIEDLEVCAQALYQAVQGAGDKRENYWKNRAQPFWKEIWPQSRDRITPRIAESLALLAIATRGEFPAALKTFCDWLEPIQHLDYVISELEKSKLCEQFPSDALILLHKVINNQQWLPKKLPECLKQIVQTKPDFAQDRRYLRLLQYSRKRTFD